ncbi:translation initiation factor eIF-2B subunit delta isoform X2 [Neocloeon triangulifer]|nr:translation initiation factor eIF-2B subunit delta isoform X2 [Neocloeon triangulifer]
MDEAKPEMTREEIMAARKAKKEAKKGKENKKAEPKNEPKAKESVAAPKEKELPKVEPKKKEKRNESVAAPKVKEIQKEEVKKEIASPEPAQQQKSNKELKEERRLKQEAQRAAKAQKDKEKGQSKEMPSKPVQQAPAQIVKAPAKVVRPALHGLARTVAAMKRENAFPQSELSEIHPAFLQLGAQLRSRLVDGCTARSVALTRALMQLINDYHTPENVELGRHLAERVQQHMAYLDTCRPNSVSMEQAVKALRINSLPYGIAETEAKSVLNKAALAFVNKLDQDSQSVALNLADKMGCGDVILVYSYSHLIVSVLAELMKQIKFQVVVVGSKTHNSGLRMLQKLTEMQLSCTYLLVNQVTFIMPKVQLVLLGADSMTANSSMIGPAGSAQLATVAKAQGVPVYACCETNKFSYQSHLSPFYQQNELVPNSVAPQLKNLPKLTQCSLLYDVVPERLITAILTEVSVLPCSSVPVVLHMQSSDTVLKTRTN